MADAFDVLDDAFDVSCDLRVHRSVFEGLGLDDEVVKGFGEFALDGAGGFLAGGVAFDDEEVEDVEGHGDVAAEDFGELSVVLGEGAAAVAFDVEDSDDAVEESERDGERGACLVEAVDVPRVRGGVVAEIGFACGGDVAADAVVLFLRIEFDGAGFGGESRGDDEVEFVGFLVEDSDGEVVEMEEVVGETDDLAFEEFESFGDVEFFDGVGVEADEFAARFVDGEDFGAEAFLVGGVADEGDDASWAGSCDGADDDLKGAFFFCEVDAVESLAYFSGRGVGGEGVGGAFAEFGDSPAEAGGVIAEDSVGDDGLAVVFGDAEALGEGLDDCGGVARRVRAVEWSAVHRVILGLVARHQCRQQVFRPAAPSTLSIRDGMAGAVADPEGDRGFLSAPAFVWLAGTDTSYRMNRLHGIGIFENR